MWLRSQAEDLEVPWRAAGKSPHEKTEETGVGCPWAQQQEQTLSTGRIEPQALAGSCFSRVIQESSWLTTMLVQPPCRVSPFPRWWSLNGNLQKHLRSHARKCALVVTQAFLDVVKLTKLVITMESTKFSTYICQVRTEGQQLPLYLSSWGCLPPSLFLPGHCFPLEPFRMLEKFHHCRV